MPQFENMSWPSGSGPIDERSTTSTSLRPKIYPGTQTTFSAISESISDVSNEGMTYNIPRTIQWLESVQTEQDEIPTSEYKFDISDDRESKEAPFTALFKERSSSLVAIGDDLLLEAGIKASMEERKTALHVDSNRVLDTTSQKHTEKVQTGAEKKETKSAKKKKKKRNRTKSEPIPKIQDSGREGDLEVKARLSKSFSQDSAQMERTIGDRLFIDIPTIGNKEYCATKPCCEAPTEDGCQMDPKMMTPPRQLSPLTKVGCCNKRGNGKKNKRR
jgi:hypothetical protein